MASVCLIMYFNKRHVNFCHGDKDKIIFKATKVISLGVIFKKVDTRKDGVYSSYSLKVQCSVTSS